VNRSAAGWVLSVCLSVVTAVFGVGVYLGAPGHAWTPPPLVTDLYAGFWMLMSTMWAGFAGVELHQRLRVRVPTWQELVGAVLFAALYAAFWIGLFFLVGYLLNRDPPQ